MMAPCCNACPTCKLSLDERTEMTPANLARALSYAEREFRLPEDGSVTGAQIAEGLVFACTAGDRWEVEAATITLAAMPEGFRRDITDHARYLARKEGIS